MLLAVAKRGCWGAGRDVVPFTAPARWRPLFAIGRGHAHGGILGILCGHSPNTSWETPWARGGVAQPGSVATRGGFRPCLRGRRFGLAMLFTVRTGGIRREDSCREESAARKFGNALDAAALENIAVVGAVPMTPRHHGRRLGTNNVRRKKQNRIKSDCPAGSVLVLHGAPLEQAAARI